MILKKFISAYDDMGWGICCNTSNETLLLYLEWELMTKPLTVTRVNDNACLPKGQKRIIITRDKNYNLQGKLQFEDDNFGYLIF